MIGRTLGHYQVLEKLGAGGMGEVYRARDTRLNRDVALKVLHPAFANDPERMARFEREAQLLASLNHSHIAILHGLEESSGVRALVLEYVPGDSLHGPLPLEEALPIARQIAEALEYAHDRGIIHRDLKPANIKITPDGKVKVLDFGLAKALDAAPAASQASPNSPTLSLAATRAGVILGTAAYMSPEQAKGQPVDRRADIWAFGVVLCEMLTGRQLFAADTVAETLALVMTKDPALPEAPPAIASLLRRCLDRDWRRRLQAIGEARIILEEPSSGSGSLPIPTSPRRWPVRAMAGLAVVAALAGALAVWALRPSATVPPLRKLELAVARLDSTLGSPFALSPDGNKIAYTSQNRLWVREFDQFEPREIPGSAGAGRPFWSPDSSQVGYLGGGKLWRAAASGAGLATICAISGGSNDAGGGVWTRDGRVLFSTGSSGLFAVSANGGDPKPVLESDAESETDFHHPSGLPEDRGVIFAVHRKTTGYDTLAVWNGRQRQVILQLTGQSLSNPVYSPTGHILYYRWPNNAGIWALPFSVEKLKATGEPFLAFPNANYPAVAPDSTLAMVRGAGSWGGQLVWVDREGRLVGKIGEAQPLSPVPALSPDGRRLAIVNLDPSQSDIWIHNLVRGVRTRLTFGPESELVPVWSPAGDRIAYRVGASTADNAIWWKAADGSGQAEELVKGHTPSFSADGKTLLYSAVKGRAFDLWRLPLTGDRKPVPILESPGVKLFPRLSPDNQYVAYASDESGREQVYLTRFPGGEGKWQVSLNGGMWPHWSAQGHRLFYTEPDNTVVEVEVTLRPALQFGAPRKLFSRPRSGSPPPFGWADGFDVSKDGSRFVITQHAEQSGPAVISVVQNWFQEFRK